MLFVFLIASLTLCVKSAVNVCPAMTGIAESECGSDSKCTGSKGLVCCGEPFQARLKQFKVGHMTEIPKNTKCRNLFKWILNSGFAKFVARKPLSSSCSRQELETGQKMGMIVHAIEVLTTVPTAGVISLEYFPDENWRNLEKYSELTRDLWDLKKCHDLRGIAQNGELTNYISELVDAGSSVEDQRWLISAFLQYCSIDLYDTLIRRKEVSKEALELFPIYARAYLLFLSEYDLETMGKWGQLPKVIAHFFHMAAAGAFNKWRDDPYTSCSDGFRTFIPQEFMNKFFA